MALTRRFAGIGTAFLFTFALIAVFSGPAAAQTDGSMQYCEISFTGCPEDYDGRELVVPLNVVALSSQIRACGITDTITGQGGGGTPPAVVFVIDHSGSMAGTNGHDRLGHRFRVTRALIDSIYAVYPSAEVGIIAFDIGLSFDSRRDSNLVVYGGPPIANSAGSPIAANRQSYMPLRPLNAPARRGGVSVTNGSGASARQDGPFYSADRQPDPLIIDVYRAMFTTPASITQEATITGGPATGSGTNIAIAFKAALETFATTNVPKENQYIIFLSDGEPNPRNCARTAADDAPCWGIYDFMYGEDIPNVPATFTVFLNRLGGRDQLPMILDTVSSVPWGTRLAPDNARTVDTTLYQVLRMTSPQTVPGMTHAIRNNGYSETNLLSDIWVLQSNYEEMLQLMMDNIITPMLSNTTGDPKSIVISTVGASDSTGAVGGNFTFSRRLPIDTTDAMQVTMGIRYDVRIDSSWTRPDGTPDSTYRIVRDSLFIYDFAIRRTAAPGTNWQDQGLSAVCGSQPTLNLLFQGDTLASSHRDITGQEAKGNMDRLTVVFNNTGGLFDYNTVVVQVMNTQGDFIDIENLTMVRGTGNNRDVWTVSFPRSEATAANPGDGRLQHAALDSIVVVFRNPEFPLDTLRIGVPYISSTMAFYDRPGDPSNASRLPDDTTLVAGTTFDLYAKFYDVEGKWDESMELDKSRITWTVSGGSNATIVGDGVHGRFYSDIVGMYSITATYRDGPLTISESIHITVVPGPPEYLEVLTDTTRILTRVDTLRLQEDREIEIERGVDRVVFYVVERDRFGNLIGYSVGATWDSNNSGTLPTTGQGDGSSGLVERPGNSFADGLLVTVNNNGLTANIKVTLVGASSAGVGPNPFVPGTRVEQRLMESDGTGRTLEFYRDIIAGSTNKTGVLITATPARRVRTSANGNPLATVVIYDAVGNVVFRSRPNDIVLAQGFDNPTFGFVWDGKNNANRTVGPGTYLVRIVATLANGERYTESRKIGVTTGRN
jgi:hypothetical protein